MEHSGRKMFGLLLTLAMALLLIPAFCATAYAANEAVYTVNIPSKVTVTHSGWNDTAGISATGSLPPKTMLVVTAESDGEFALTSRFNDKIPYFIHADKRLSEYLKYDSYDSIYQNYYVDLDHPATYEFASLSNSPTTQTLGIIVKNYDDMRNGTYTDTITFTAKVDVLGLNHLTGDYTAVNGDILTGTLPYPYKVFIADGATVTLRDMKAVGEEYSMINCMGNATIFLAGSNEMQAYGARPAIYIPQGKTLTIRGNGSLNASSVAGVAIGGGNWLPGGNIVIESGTINAYTTGMYGHYGAAIGGGEESSCGDITIKGGTVTARADGCGAAIGSGYYDGSCGNITITGGTVHATGDGGAAIGCGFGGHCGNITIANTVTKVTAIRRRTETFVNSNGDLQEAPASIGKGTVLPHLKGSCGTIRIGGTVYQSIYENEFTYQP